MAGSGTDETPGLDPKSAAGDASQAGRPSPVLSLEHAAKSFGAVQAVVDPSDWHICKHHPAWCRK